jgi:general secretion pathway protein M
MPTCSPSAPNWRHDVSRTLPSGRPGQILALGMTALLLAAIWVAIAQPLLGWYADRAAGLSQRTALVRRMDALVAGIAPLQASLAGATTSSMTGVAVLPGNTDAIAAANLQQHVQDMATRAGMALASTETLPASSAGAYRRIGLHVSAVATWPVLVTMLESVDQANPRMLIDDLQLHGPHLVVMPAEPPLQLSFIVYAFRTVIPRAGTASAPAR